VSPAIVERLVLAVVWFDAVAAPLGKADEEITTAPVLQAVTLPSREVVSPAIVARLVFAVDWFDAVAAPLGKADEEITTAPVLQAVTLPSREVVSPAIVARLVFAVDWFDAVAAPLGKALEEITTAPVTWRNYYCSCITSGYFTIKRSSITCDCGETCVGCWLIWCCRCTTW